MRHVVIFGILYIARRHPTKLSEAYPPPLLYVGLPWGDGETPDSGLHAHIGSWERIFHFLSYCTFYVVLWTLLHLFTHVSLFWSGYVVYHLLGRVGIRLCILFTLLVCITFEVWQPDMWVCSPSYTLSIFMLSHVLIMIFVELRKDMGGMYACGA